MQSPVCMQQGADAAQAQGPAGESTNKEAGDAEQTSALPAEEPTPAAGAIGADAAAGDAKSRDVAAAKPEEASTAAAAAPVTSTAASAVKAGMCSMPGMCKSAAGFRYPSANLINPHSQCYLLAVQLLGFVEDACIKVCSARTVLWQPT